MIFAICKRELYLEILVMEFPLIVFWILKEMFIFAVIRVKWAVAFALHSCLTLCFHQACSCNNFVTNA
jgi:hypothetical protein